MSKYCGQSLDQELLKASLHYDQETGLFTRIGWRAGALAGTPGSKGYINIKIGRGAPYLAHRLAWLYMTGAWPEHEVDHIDNDRANNAWANLRSVTHGQNMQNMHRCASNRTGFLGVTGPTPGNQEYMARIKVNGVLHYLGRFPTAEDAHAAYLRARQTHHPFYAGNPAQGQAA